MSLPYGESTVYRGIIFRAFVSHYGADDDEG